MALISQLSVNLNANTRGLEKGFKKAKRKVNDFTKSIFNIKTAVAGALGIGGIGAMVGNLVAVNSEMQRLKSGLKTVTGSAENASAAFDKIKKFSVETPFELNEITDAFIRLKAYGLDPSERALKSYGNVASAMGKSLNQVIEAVADATTGEFERLKEFGIRAAKIKNTDLVKLTFQGVTDTIKLNSEAITGYLQAIGENQFAGAMEDQMRNLGPAFSNLRTAVQDLKIAIGEGGLNDAISAVVNATTDWVNTLDRSQIAEWTQGVISGFAGFLDMASSVYDYISGNKFLQWGGLIGFALFGKLGIGAVALIDKVNTMMAQDVAGIWEKLNPGIAGGQNLMPAGHRFRENYQLGDLNYQGGQEQRQNREMLAEKYGSKIFDETRGQTNVLNDIADLLRGSQATPATAG